MRHCVLADNEDAGLFYEISFGLHAHDNVIVGNGFGGTPGAWGADGGIAISSSPGCTLERNLVIGNKEGIQFREQNRTTPRIDGPAAEEPVWNRAETIRRNLLAYNRDAQLWGWFDIADERHWPAALQQKVSSAGGAAGEAAPGPVEPCLERLGITITGNLYAAAPGQGLLHWGTTWKRHRQYAALDDVRAELGFEQDGAAGEPGFADPLARDYRVPADSPAVAMGCYPQGGVPGVVLGVLPPGR